jgi:methyltransferase (TIGR00027 family)
MRQASRTAELMAVQRAIESGRPADSRLFVDPLAPAFLSPPWRVVVQASRLPGLRRLVCVVYDRVAGPGPRPSAVARTRLIDDIVGEAIRDGITQVVVLGAGFDSRAYRLADVEGVRFFEVDHPATQRVKTETVRRVLGRPPSHVTFVPTDFEHEDVEPALRSGRYEERSPGLFLWEGVTNYLSAAAVDDALNAVRHLAAPGSTLVFTYVHREVIDNEHSALFPEARRWVEGVKRRGEPWTFGLDPAEVDGFLEARGFRLQRDLSTAEAGDLYFPQLGRKDRGSGLYHVVTASM